MRFIMRLKRFRPETKGRSYWVRTIYVVVAVVLVLCLLGVTMRKHLFELLPYSTSSFSGDATIRDYGFWTYPRYEISFPKIPLNRPGRHVYFVRGLPPPRLTLCLTVPWPSEAMSLSQSESKLRGLTSSSNVRVTISDDSGNVVCERSLSLCDWVLSVSIADARFWLPAFRDLRFRRTCQYTVAIEVDCDNTTFEPVMAEPILAGGGIESP